MRDITLEETIYFNFTTRSFTTGVPTTLAGSPVLSVLESNNATPITAGVSINVDRASVTGLNQATVVATAANGYEAGKSYSVYISTGTVGGVSVVGEAVAQFTVQSAASFTRLGAPAGASVSADVAAVKVDTAAVKVKTDFLPSATAGAAGGIFIAGTNAATTVTTSFTTTFTGNLTGSIGSVTGAVGSVTNRVTANTDQLAGQTVTAGAGVTFPASVASPTNITAGVITTVTNLTNAATVGDLTAAMKTSVTTAATAATPIAASVTGAVGSVTAGVTVSTNSDKTGYALSAAYDPAKTASQAGDAMSLIASYDFAKGTVAMTEGYATDGSTVTPSQMLYMLWSLMAEKNISGTTLTSKKLDGTTSSMTFTLSDAISPVSITRST